MTTHNIVAGHVSPNPGIRATLRIVAVLSQATSFLLGSCCALAFGHTIGLLSPVDHEVPKVPPPSPQRVKPEAAPSVTVVGRPVVVDPPSPSPPPSKRSRKRRRGTPPPSPVEAAPPAPAPDVVRAPPVVEKLRRAVNALDPEDASARHAVMGRIKDAAEGLPRPERTVVDGCLGAASIKRSGDAAKKTLLECVAKLNEAL